jgi:phenylalanyl-tRNA synthetase beta chain
VFVPSENELPSEKVKLSLAVCGGEESVGWDKGRAVYDFFDLKGVLQSLATEFRLGDLKIKPEKYIFFEKATSFDVYFGGELCGFCGEVAGKARDQYDVEMPVFYSEIDISVLLNSFSDDRVFIPIPKYPSSLRDIALVLNRDVPAEDVREEIVVSGGVLVTKVVLFDVYEGKQIPMGKKSLAYSIEYRSNEKTLTDEEIDIAHNRIVDGVSEKFSAELRT